MNFSTLEKVVWQKKIAITLFTHPKISLTHQGIAVFLIFFHLFPFLWAIHYWMRLHWWLTGHWTRFFPGYYLLCSARHHWTLEKAVSDVARPSWKDARENNVVELYWYCITCSCIFTETSPWCTHLKKHSENSTNKANLTLQLLF